MKTKKQIRNVRNKTYKMGNNMYKIYLKEGGIENLKASVAAFNVCIRAIKYELIFKN